MAAVYVSAIMLRGIRSGTRSMDASLRKQNIVSWLMIFIPGITATDFWAGRTIPKKKTNGTRIMKLLWKQRRKP